MNASVKLRRPRQLRTLRRRAVYTASKHNMCNVRENAFGADAVCCFCMRASHALDSHQAQLNANTAGDGGGGGIESMQPAANATHMAVRVLYIGSRGRPTVRHIFMDEPFVRAIWESI